MEGKCPYCGSTNVEHMTRVTGFFSKIEGWNRGKIAELRDRYRGGFMDDKPTKHSAEDGYKVIKHAVEKMANDMATGKHVQENDGGGYQY